MLNSTQSINETFDQLTINTVNNVTLRAGIRYGFLTSDGMLHGNKSDFYNRNKEKIESLIQQAELYAITIEVAIEYKILKPTRNQPAPTYDDYKDIGDIGRNFGEFFASQVILNGVIPSHSLANRAINQYVDNWASEL